MGRVTAVSYTERELLDIMVTIVEGGVTHWAFTKVVERDDETRIPKLVELSWQVVEGEGEGWSSDEITPRDVQHAINNVLGDDSFNGQSRAWIASGDPGQIDAEAADVIAQYAVFGKVVYG